MGTWELRIVENKHAHIQCTSSLSIVFQPLPTATVKLYGLNGSSVTTPTLSQEQVTYRELSSSSLQGNGLRCLGAYWNI